MFIKSRSKINDRKEDKVCDLFMRTVMTMMGATCLHWGNNFLVMLKILCAVIQILFKYSNSLFVYIWLVSPSLPALSCS